VRRDAHHCPGVRQIQQSLMKLKLIGIRSLRLRDVKRDKRPQRHGGTEHQSAKRSENFFLLPLCLCVSITNSEIGLYHLHQLYNLARKICSRKNLCGASVKLSGRDKPAAHVILPRSFTKPITSITGNTFMYSQTKRNSVFALAVVLAFVLACSGGNETDQANKLVAEGNAAINEGNKLATEAGAKNDSVFDQLSADDFEASKEKLSPTAKEAVDGLTKSAAKYREAAKKFEEASKLKIDDKFKEYLSLKSQEFNKRAEQMDVGKGNAQALLDSSDMQGLTAEISKNRTRYQSLDKESKDLEAKAAKIREDNKDKIQ
jgi:hypothetical protein